MQHLKHLFLRAQKMIEQAEKILIITHYNPDGDGLSSSCAIAEYLCLQKKDYQLYCHSQPPKAYDFLPHIEEFGYAEDRQKNKKNGQALDFSKFDLIIVFDCGSLSRTKLEKELTGRNKNQLVIEIDHHPKVDDYADLEIREPRAAATAELVYCFFLANQITLNKTIANSLITGLITDTANFLYPATSNKTVGAAAELVRLGAQLPKITEKTMRNKSLAAMRLWGRIMANLEINKKYNLAFTILPKEEFSQNEIDIEELEGVSGFLSSLEGVKGVLFLREEADGVLRGSLRTAHKKIDISKLAKLLGGGGHAKASGFALRGRLKKTPANRWQVEID
jgi:phosphoesterase RecJ-like protein